MVSDQVPAQKHPPLRADTRAKMEIVLSALWALPSNGKTVTASLREIQKLTGLARGTVAAALRRCVDFGKIGKVGNSRRTDWWGAADSFRLLEPPIAQPSWLWCRAGFGVTGVLILMSMSPSESMTTAEIAEAASVAPRTVRKYMAKFHSAAFVVSEDRGRWRRLDDPEYFALYEEFLVGRVKRLGCRQLTEQQVTFKKVIDATQPEWFQRGHSGNNGPSRLRLLGPHGSPSAKPQSEADGHSQSA